jgi:hypothetical protein
MLLLRAAVKSYADDAALDMSPMTLQSMYDNGLPTRTATTITATRNRLSMMVLIKKGRMPSKNRMTVMAQYRTETQTWNQLSGLMKSSAGVVTHDTEGADEHIWRDGVGRNHFGNEICSHSDDCNHGNRLHEAGYLECGPEGAMIRASHIEVKPWTGRSYGVREDTSGKVRFD